LLDNATSFANKQQSCGGSLPRESMASCRSSRAGRRRGSRGFTASRRNRGGERRRDRPETMRKFSRRLPGGCAARHRGTLGPCPRCCVCDWSKVCCLLAIQVGQTAGESEEADFLGQSFDHGRAAQLVAACSR
jgi:hypothetical protein